MHASLASSLLEGPLISHGFKPLASSSIHTLDSHHGCNSNQVDGMMPLTTSISHSTESPRKSLKAISLKVNQYEAGGGEDWKQKEHHSRSEWSESQRCVTRRGSSNQGIRFTVTTYHLMTAHLEVKFRFFGLSTRVERVLGRTYHPDFKNTKPAAAMTVVGGEDKYRTKLLLSPDYKLSLF